MNLGLEGKVVVITGGSRGIGFGIAESFRSEGSHVLIVSRKEPELANARDSLASQPGDGDVEYLVGHAGSSESAVQCMEVCMDRWGKVDVLINNAAANPYQGPMIEIGESQAMKTSQVNQYGILAWTRAARDASMASHGGSVINITSAGGYVVDDGVGYYNSTKAAIMLMTRQLAYELGPAIRVNAIAPGLVKTKFAESLWTGREEEISSVLPLNRLGEVSDIATVAAFLSSDAASWVTGVTVPVDGGSLCMPLGLGS